MLYVALDEHSRQITISLRDDSGDVLQVRQVFTGPEKIKHKLRRFHQQWNIPQDVPTQRAMAWLKQLVLPKMDCLEMNY